MKMKQLRRWIAGCMACLMLAGMVHFPPPVRAAESPPDDSLTVFDKLGFDTGAPEGCKEQEPITDTPYGRQFITMNPVDELMLIEGSRDYTFYGVDEKMAPLHEANEAYFQDESRRRFEHDEGLIGKLDGIGNMYPDALIALEGNFCVSNHGKRANTILVSLETTLPEDKGDAWVHGNMYVADIGRYLLSNDLATTVFNNRASILFGSTESFRIGKDGDAVDMNDPYDSNQQHEEGDFGHAYLAYNYLAAATGDFDADGIDEIAWYVPDAQDPRIEIWDLQDSDSSDPNEISAYLYAANWKLAQVFRLETEGQRAAPDAVSLFTSDLNRDGTDDLAITWGKISALPAIASRAA